MIKGAMTLPPEKTAAKMNAILEAGVKPYAGEIAQLWFQGLLPVVIYKPERESIELLDRLFPTRGENRVFGVDREKVAAIFATTAGDRAWLETQPTEDGPLHFWLIVERGNLCMVINPGGGGFTTAPGTSDLDLS